MLAITIIFNSFFPIHVIECQFSHIWQFRYKKLKFVYIVNGNRSKTAKIIKKMVLLIGIFYDFSGF